MNPARDSAFADELWRGYDLRAAVPMLVLAGLLTVALLVSRLAFNDFLDAILTYVLVLVIWPVLLFVAVYRAVTYTYRITDRALLVDRGFLNRPITPLAYSEMTQVEHGGHPVHTWLGIGWVRVSMADGRVVRLPALRDPAAFAAVLRERLSSRVEQPDGIADPH